MASTKNSEQQSIRQYITTCTCNQTIRQLSKYCCWTIYMFLLCLFSDLWLWPGPCSWSWTWSHWVFDWVCCNKVVQSSWDHAELQRLQQGYWHLVCGLHSCRDVVKSPSVSRKALYPWIYWKTFTMLKVISWSEDESWLIM